MGCGLWAVGVSAADWCLQSDAIRFWLCPILVVPDSLSRSRSCPLYLYYVSVLFLCVYFSLCVYISLSVFLSLSLSYLLTVLSLCVDFSVFVNYCFPYACVLPMQVHDLGISRWRSGLPDVRACPCARPRPMCPSPSLCLKCLCLPCLPEPPTCRPPAARLPPTAVPSARPFFWLFSQSVHLSGWLHSHAPPRPPAPIPSAPQSVSACHPPYCNIAAFIAAFIAVRCSLLPVRCRLLSVHSPGLESILESMSNRRAGGLSISLTRSTGPPKCFPLGALPDLTSPRCNVSDHYHSLAGTFPCMGYALARVSSADRTDDIHPHIPNPTRLSLTLPAYPSAYTRTRARALARTCTHTPHTRIHARTHAHPHPHPHATHAHNRTHAGHGRIAVNRTHVCMYAWSVAWT